LGIFAALGDNTVLLISAA